MGKGKSWSEEELKQLRIMVGRGMTDAEIAGFIGRSKAAIGSMRLKLGIERGGRENGWTQAEDDALIIGRAQGLSAEDIGRRIGRTKYAVWHRATMLGITKSAEPQQMEMRFEPKEVRTDKAVNPVDTINDWMTRTERLQAELDELKAENAKLKATLYRLEAWASKPPLRRGTYYEQR